MSGGVFRRQWKRYAPPWFDGPAISVFYESLGSLLDCEAQRAMDGRLASIVYAGAEPNAAKLSTGQRIECQPDVLATHAENRGIVLYKTMPTIGQRVNLSRWRQLRARKGTHRGALEHVQPYFLPGPLPTIRIVHQAGDGSSATWHKINPSGVYSYTRATPSNFNYDGRASPWSRWWAFVDMTGTGVSTGTLYGGGHTYGDGSVYGGGLTPAQTADIAAMFRWKASHSWLAGVVLMWANPIDPAGTPTQDADGRWSLPSGANTWSVLADPGTGKATRPANWQWIYDNPAP